MFVYLWISYHLLTDYVHSELNVHYGVGYLLVLTLEIIAYTSVTLCTLVFFSHKPLKRKSDVSTVHNYMTVKEMQDTSFLCIYLYMLLLFILITLETCIT
jgi:hypothetical protein